MLRRVLNVETALRTLLLNMVNALRRVPDGADGVIWGAVEDPGPPAPGHSPAKKATTVWAREPHSHQTPKNMSARSVLIQ